MTITIIIIAVYVLSVAGAYKFIQKAHSRGGRWSALVPDLSDVVVTFCPMLNTATAIMFLAGAWREEELERALIEKRNFSKFFSVKD